MIYFISLKNEENNWDGIFFGIFSVMLIYLTTVMLSQCETCDLDDRSPNLNEKVPNKTQFYHGIPFLDKNEW